MIFPVPNNRETAIKTINRLINSKEYRVEYANKYYFTDGTIDDEITHFKTTTLYRHMKYLFSNDNDAMLEPSSKNWYILLAISIVIITYQYVNCVSRMLGCIPKYNKSISIDDNLLRVVYAVKPYLIYQ